VKWYERKKANNSDWSVRMVHVDKAAVLHPNANVPSFLHEDWYGVESQAGVTARGDVLGVGCALDWYDAVRYLE